MGKIILQWKTSKLLPKGSWLNHFLKLEQYMSYITTIELPSVAFKVTYHFPHTPTKDRNS